MRIGEEKRFNPLISTQTGNRRVEIKSDITGKDQVSGYTPDLMAELHSKMAQLQKQVFIKDLKPVDASGDISGKILPVNSLETSIVSTVGGALAGVAIEHFNEIDRSKGEIKEISSPSIDKMKGLLGDNNWNFAPTVIGGNLTGTGALYFNEISTSATRPASSLNKIGEVLGNWDYTLQFPPSELITGMGGNLSGVTFEHYKTFA